MVMVEAIIPDSPLRAQRSNLFFPVRLKIVSSQIYPKEEGLLAMTPPDFLRVQ